MYFLLITVMLLPKKIMANVLISQYYSTGGALNPIDDIFSNEKNSMSGLM